MNYVKVLAETVSKRWFKNAINENETVAFGDNFIVYILAGSPSLPKEKG